MVWRPGLPAEAATDDPGLHKGPPVLGGKSPATAPRQTSLTGRKCAGAVMGDEALVTFTDEEVLEDLQPSYWVQFSRAQPKGMQL